MMSTFKLAAFFTSGAVLSNGNDPWGCCYNVGFGAYMKECCQEPTQGGDVFLSSCRLQNRAGGATWFVEYETCAWMKNNVWNQGVGSTGQHSGLKIDKPAVTLSMVASDNSYNNPQGCCFNVGFGDGMKECCQAPTQGGDVRKSDCNLQQRMGGATWFVENQSCAWMEQNVWGRGFLTTSANVRLDKPSGDSNLLLAAVAYNPLGCCFNVGFGAGMKECCQEPTQGGDVRKADCTLQQRMGGATWFVENETCAWMESNVWSRNFLTTSANVRLDKPSGDLVLAQAVHNPLGCCFNVGFGAGMKECCQEPTQGGDVRLSDCNLQQRMGGATWFVENQTCEWMEINVWARGFLTTSSNVRLDKPSNDYNMAALTVNSATKQAPIHSTLYQHPTGCCYSFGYGAGMEPCCFKALLGNWSNEADCEALPNAVRMGGQNRFVEHLSCSDTKAAGPGFWG